MEGWELLERHLARLSREVSEYFYAAETPEEFWYRKGYMDGHNRTLNYGEVLIGLSEASDGEVLREEVAKLMAPYQQLGLTQEPAEPGDEELARISRVLKHAGRR